MGFTTETHTQINISKLCYSLTLLLTYLFSGKDNFGKIRTTTMFQI